MAAEKGNDYARKYTDEDIERIKNNLIEYIENEEMPIIAEFCYKNDIPKSTLYSLKEVSTLLKKAINKKETYLEKESLKNKINPTVAIFSLKQLGWSDKIENRNLNINADVENEGDLDSLINKYLDQRNKDNDVVGETTITK